MDKLLFLKKAQSQVIASILLILLAISMVVIVIGIVIPFVQDQLAESDCVKLIGKVTIQNNPRYTCYEVVGGGEMNVQVHITDNESLEGFTVELGGASSRSFEIKDGVTSSELRMFNGNYSDPLLIPGKNEERTYTVNAGSVPDSINVYPILVGGKVCSSSGGLSKIVSC